MRLVLTAEARLDLIYIYDFNLRRGEAWADRVQRRLLERAKALLLAPRSGRPLGRQGTRRLSVPDIQYVVDYEVTADAVRILQVRSTREMQ